ncbi:MAG: ferritin-like domain-containing protein [Planctomycetota bacterium]
MANSIEEAIQLARKMELDGIEFYGKAADNAGNPQAQKFFESLQSDEQRHLDIVEKIGKGMGVDVEGMGMPADNIKTVFSSADQEIAAGEQATAEEKEAVEMALGMEEESYDLYEEAAEKTNDDEQKSLFERLAAEENQHFVMLENTQEYLEDNGRWVLWDESALLMGDMSSLGS